MLLSELNTHLNANETDLLFGIRNDSLDQEINKEISGRRFIAPSTETIYSSAERKSTGLGCRPESRNTGSTWCYASPLMVHTQPPRTKIKVTRKWRY